MKDSIYKSRKYVWVSAGILVVVWAIVARWLDNEIIVPSPVSAVHSLLDIVKGKNFLKLLMATLSRSCTSFLISVVLALVLGVLSGLVRWAYHMMIPVVSVLKSVPTMAVIILGLIWLDSESAPILIGIILVFPVLYESVVEGMLNVDQKLLQMAELYSVSTKNIILGIYMPTVGTYLSTVIGAALGLTLKAVIAGEVLGQPKYSIGGSLQMEKMYLNTSGVFAWIIIVVVLSILLERIVKLFFIKVNSWK